MDQHRISKDPNPESRLYSSNTFSLQSFIRTCKAAILEERPPPHLFNAELTPVFCPITLEKGKIQSEIGQIPRDIGQVPREIGRASREMRPIEHYRPADNSRSACYKAVFVQCNLELVQFLEIFVQFLVIFAQ